MIQSETVLFVTTRIRPDNCNFENIVRLYKQFNCGHVALHLDLVN